MEVDEDGEWGLRLSSYAEENNTHTHTLPARLERERVGVPTIGRLVVDLAAVPIHRRVDVAQRPVQVLKQSQLLPFVNLKDGGRGKEDGGGEGYRRNEG